MEHQDLFADLAAECAVRIEGTSGNVTVIGWEEPRLQIGPETCCDVRREGQTLHITLGSGGSEDLSARLPAGCDVNVRVVSGDVQVSGLDTRLSVQTTSGDISGQELAGNADLHTVSGGVSVLQCALSNLTLETVSGDVTMASSLSPIGTYEVRTVSGDITLRLPVQQPSTVRSHSLSGDVSCRMTHELYHQGWGRLDVAVNGGGTVIRVRTTSGDLLIEADQNLLPRGEAMPEMPQVARPAIEHLAPAMVEEAEPFALDDASLSEEDRARERMRVLKAIEEGRMSVSEGLETLRNLE